MKRTAISAWLSVVLLAAWAAIAAPVPPLDINDLTLKAGMVVVGTIDSIWDGGPTSTMEDGSTITGRLIGGEILVDRVIKGQQVTSIEFQVVMPSSDSMSRIPAVDSYRVLFLKQVEDHYEFVSRYYPSVIAAAVTTSTESSALGRVVEAVAAVLTSVTYSSAAKLDALHVLGSTKSPVATVGLRSALQQQEIAVRLAAAAALLRRDDVSACPVAEPVLRGETAGVSPDLLHNLRAAVELGLKDPQSIPFLSRVLHAESVESRRVAAAALRHTSSEFALAPLVEALDDADSDVTFSAVMGLAEITGSRNRGVSHATFSLDPNRYISYWKNWAVGRF
jgi:hypothetical protein